MRQDVARYWLGTLFDWTPPDLLPEGVLYLRGQQEECPTTGRLHHQVIVGFPRPQRRSYCVNHVGPGHWESTRSDAADRYVWKEETSIRGTRFQLGEKAIRRNSATDWAKILDSAKTGNINGSLLFTLDIPADIQIRYYRSLLAIASDNERPTGIEKVVNVFFGRSGTGKSRLAWEQAGPHAYPKDPRSKWWDGYQGQEHVVIDEFRGSIDVSHILRWLDRYPVRVERKGSSICLRATTFWITSNLDPEQWYSDLDSMTLEALKRRLTNIRFFE